ncbi:MAG: pyridoxal phosphate-dependent aminotransferase [Leeuwenhoekiella sp.]|nr:pyridoxal phosphate-dependent aminotransferase [Leeuwenhoekiella sp.]
MDKPKKIALALPFIDTDATDYLAEVVNQNWVTSGGPAGTKFENQLQKFLQTEREVVALNSGTAALHLALKLAGVQRGDFVLCQTMSFVASANPIDYLGAIPVFIDSEKSTYNLASEYVKEAITWCLEQNKKPAALVAVHSFGIPCQVEEIAKLCKDYEIALIEDAAEALGSKYKNQPCGLFGDFSMLSFNGNKIITTGGGGALICKDAQKAGEARHLSRQAKSATTGFEHDAVGFNYAMPGLNAGLGLSQLQTLKERIQIKRELHQFYQECFAEIEEIEVLTAPNAAYYANYWLNVIRFTGSNSAKNPERFQAFLAEKGIESRFPWKPLHLQEIYGEQHYFGAQNAETLWKTGLCLPSGCGLTKEDLNRIQQAINAYFSV